MIKVANIVQEIVTASEIALSALNAGYLNLSAYAHTIKSEVEKRSKKSVRHGTIVVALSRLAKSLPARPPILPDVKAENMAVRTGLVEIAFDKTKDNRNLLRSLYQKEQFLAADFFTATHGVNELAIIVPEELSALVLKIFDKQKPKLFIDKLASVTVRYGEKVLTIPNVTFAIIRPLALKRINIVEIVSTYTELTFIVSEKDLQETFLTLNTLLRSPK